MRNIVGLSESIPSNLILVHSINFINKDKILAANKIVIDCFMFDLLSRVEHAIQIKGGWQERKYKHTDN